MTRSVLMVEDDCLEAVLFREAMRACGIGGPIAVANSAAAALSYLDERGRFDPPAFILIDVDAPGGGFTLLRCLRSLVVGVDIPAVMVSSVENATALELSAKLGADAFLVRPPDAEGLAAAFRCLAERWLPS